MGAIEHKPVSLWVIATRPYAEKIVKGAIYSNYEEAAVDCEDLNASYREIKENDSAEPYKVYALSGFMTEVKQLSHVDAAVEALRNLETNSHSVKVAEVYAGGNPDYETLRQHLFKISEIEYALARKMTLEALLQFLTELQNPTYKFERLQREAKAAHEAAMAAVPRPYPKGSVIYYGGMYAELLEDNDYSLIVHVDGEDVKWRWTCDGETCRLVDLPK